VSCWPSLCLEVLLHLAVELRKLGQQGGLRSNCLQSLGQVQVLQLPSLANPTGTRGVPASASVAFNKLAELIDRLLPSGDVQCAQGAAGEGGSSRRGGGSVGVEVAIPTYCLGLIWTPAPGCCTALHWVGSGAGMLAAFARRLGALNLQPSGIANHAWLTASSTMAVGHAIHEMPALCLFPAPYLPHRPVLQCCQRVLHGCQHW
jgi:hypothetical protein